MKSTLEEIQVRVVEILTDLISADEGEVKLESKLYADLGIDSMDTLELTMDLEEEYNIFVQDAEIEKWSTVKDITVTINQLLNN